jgi:hypothetical protein
MSARTVDTVKGIETTLAVDKADNDTFVIVKCATDINYGGDKEMLTANCYGGKEMHPSGDDPSFTLSLNGVVKEYATADEAANVSSSDLEDWWLATALKTFKYARPHVGDRVRTFDGYVTAYSEQGSANGLQTYSATITPLKKPVITAVPA